MLTIPVCCAFRAHCDQNGWALPRSVSSNTLAAMRKRIEETDRRFMVPPGTDGNRTTGARSSAILAHSPQENIKIAQLCGVPLTRTICYSPDLTCGKLGAIWPLPTPRPLRPLPPELL